MPVISYFFGIYIRMYHADHPPAHFTPSTRDSKRLSPSKQEKSSKAIFPPKLRASCRTGQLIIAPNCLQTGSRRVIWSLFNASPEPTMIKIVKAETIGPTQLRLTFSDGTQGDYDLAPLLDKDTVLTRPLKHPEYFNAHFIELGALCWRNGLELSPAALHSELRNSNKLTRVQQAA
jgi:hypothetical protein